MKPHPKGEENGGATHGEPVTLDLYLKELERDKEDKPEQVRDGLEIYVDLWRKAIMKGLVDPSDEMIVALEKVERAGGLRKVAED